MCSAFDDPPAAAFDHSALYTKLCVDSLKACGKAHGALVQPSPYAPASDKDQDKAKAAEKRPPEHADL